MLRNLFQIFSNGLNGRQSGLDRDAIHEKVDLAVDLIDKRIRGIGSYRGKLGDAVVTAMDFTSNLADNLPDPFECSGDVFTSDARVRALFSGMSHIDEVLHGDDVLPDFFRKPAHSSVDDCYVLMRVRMSERNVLGTAMVEGRLMREVPQTIVNFSGHNFVAPSHSDDVLRQGVQDYLLEELLFYAQRERAILKSERINERKGHSDLSPRESLKLIKDILQSPDQVLTLDHVGVAVDRMGVKQEKKELSGNGLRFDLPEVRVNHLNPVGLMPVLVPKTAIDLKRTRGLSFDAMRSLLHP